MLHAKYLTAAAALCLLTNGISFGQQTPRAAPKSADAQDRDQQLTDYFADVLMLANQGEIELSKIALERSTNEDVKKLAKQLIDDHTQLNAKLRQVSPAAATRAEIAGAQQRTAARDRTSHDLLTELCRINRMSAENQLKQSKELLNRYKGQDFDMAYLGLMIGSHTWFAAQLDALNDVRIGPLQKTVDAAGQHVRHHLEDATRLSGKLEDDRRAASGECNAR